MSKHIFTHFYWKLEKKDDGVKYREFFSENKLLKSFFVFLKCNRPGTFPTNLQACLLFISIDVSVICQRIKIPAEDLHDLRWIVTSSNHCEGQLEFPLEVQPDIPPSDMVTVAAAT